MKRKILGALILAILLMLAIITYMRHNTAGNTVPTSLPTPPKTQPVFDKQQFSTTAPASPWVVVNKQHPLNPIDYAPSDLTAVGNGQFMRAAAAAALQTMFAGAKADGLTLTADSGYRSYSTQVVTYNSEVKVFGEAQADDESARPGYSEHQSGWAVDIGGGGCNIADCFANTAEGKWAQTNAYRYGFILRYQAADTAITGYRAEAWHFRYVGALLAEQMHKQNIPTLEQFFAVSGGTTYKN